MHIDLLSLLTLIVLWMVVGYFIQQINQQLLVKFFRQSAGEPKAHQQAIALTVWPVFPLFWIFTIPAQLVYRKG